MQAMMTGWSALVAMTIIATPAAAQQTVDDHRWYAARSCGAGFEGEDCRRAVMGCIYEDASDLGVCPDFKTCSYLVDGRVVSEDRCASMARVGAVGGSVAYTWRNGNTMGYRYDIETGEEWWNGVPAITRDVNGRDCLAITSTGEAFCTSD